ncbi:MAG TPA: hypothetical protein VFJ75_10160 [Gaiellaceae bacterium]|nr:hypothetical protein [Gaiellaceae bacterium]
MSVIMTAWVQGDPEKLEQWTAENRETMQQVLASAKEHGLIAHRFYGSDGQIMVIDEWPDPDSFERFFKANEAQIGPMFEAAGAQAEPGINFWHLLETHDAHGWDA